MNSVKDSTVRESLLARLTHLTPERRGQWGSMTAHGMVCHLSDQMRVALNDVACKRRDNLLSRTVAHWLVIHTPLPTPRGRIQTAPEMQQTPPGDWATDLAACGELLRAVGNREATGIHPAFGPLSDREWGLLVWKHMDHHLKQFGV